MEANRQRVFKVLGSLAIVGLVGAALYGLTGVIRDPSIPTEQQQQAMAAVQRGPVGDATGAKAATPPAGKAEETLAKVEEKEPFPQFDDEPSGS